MQIGVNELSNKCLMIIKEDISEHNFNTWFTPIVPLKFSNNTLTLEVPSQFFYEWLEENYVSIFRKAIDLVIGKNGMLEYSVVIDKGDRKNPPITFNLPTNHSNQNTYNSYSDKYSNNQTSSTKNPFQFKDLDSLELDSYLIPKYTFDKFIEGDCNRLGRAAGMAVSNKPGLTSFNPLMIYGGVGLGKTHLIQAIGNQIKDQYPEKFVLYVSTEKFTNQFVNAIRNNSIETFTNFYLQVDVLIIDDVQFLSGKSGTQDVFFHIFNYLHQNGKQVILTSDKAPVDMQDIEQRLLSRFKWGLSAELHQPDYETRVSILKNILYRDGVEMPEEIIEYVARNIKTNVRELEGAIISLIAQSSFNKKEVTIELAKSIVEKFVKNVKREISIDYIQKIVSDYFQLDLETLQSKTRKRHVVQARQLAMFFAKKFTKASLANIGSQIGDRDHATVLHACKTVDNLVSTDKQFKKFVEDIHKKLTL